MESENKMAYKPINTLILQMSAPPLISMFLQYSYNLVDSMFVAKINEQALAAVSLSFPITTLMNALSIWIGVGVNVLIAGYLGQKKQEKPADHGQEIPTGSRHPAGGNNTLFHSSIRHRRRNHGIPPLSGRAHD